MSQSLENRISNYISITTMQPSTTYSQVTTVHYLLKQEGDVLQYEAETVQGII